MHRLALIVLGFACTLGALPAEDRALAESLEQAGMSPRVDDAGQLEAVYRFAPDGTLPEATWEALAGSSVRILNASKVTPEDLHQIGQVASLEELVIGGGSTFREDDLAALTLLPKLRLLNLHHLKDFEGNGFGHFVGNGSVEELVLHNLRPFRGSAYEGIAGMQNLKALEVTAVLHGIEALEPLRGHPTLERFTFPVREESIGATLDLAASWPQLHELHLLFPSGKLTLIHDQQIEVLAEMSGLTHLRASNLGLTEAQAHHLREKLPGLKIELRRKSEVHAESEPMAPLK